MHADHTLDTRELACPMPLLKTRQALRSLPSGETLLVMATDPGSCRDIPAYLGQSVHRLVQQQEKDGAFHFLISVGKES